MVANFNSLGSTVTSIDDRVSTLESQVGAIDGRVTALENSGGVAPTADLTVNSLTATTFVETPQLQNLQIQNCPGNGPQGRRRAAGQLRRRRHQPRQGRDGGGGQHPERHHGGHHAAHRGQHGRNGRLQLLTAASPPTWRSLASIEGGAQGVLVNDTLLVNGAIAPEPSLDYLFLSGGTWR